MYCFNTCALNARINRDIRDSAICPDATCCDDLGNHYATQPPGTAFEVGHPPAVLRPVLPALPALALPGLPGLPRAADVALVLDHHGGGGNMH